METLSNVLRTLKAPTTYSDMCMYTVCVCIYTVDIYKNKTSLQWHVYQTFVVMVTTRLQNSHLLQGPTLPVEFNLYTTSPTFLLSSHHSSSCRNYYGH